jgi:hypothetical protein
LSADGTDSHGTNDLTNNNAVTFVAKGAGAPANMPANVANFVAASSQYFSRAAMLTADQNVTMAFWMNTVSTGNTFCFVDHSDGNFYVRTWSGPLQLYTRAFADNVAKTGTDHSTAWHLVVVWHDADANRLGIVMDEANLTTKATAGTNNASSATNIGRYGGAIQYVNGQMSNVLLWSRVLTAGERADLYASGNGLFY